MKHTTICVVAACLLLAGCSTGLPSDPQQDRPDTGEAPIKRACCKITLTIVDPAGKGIPKIGVNLNFVGWAHQSTWFYTNADGKVTFQTNGSSGAWDLNILGTVTDEVNTYVGPPYLQGTYHSDVPVTKDVEVKYVLAAPCK